MHYLHHYNNNNSTDSCNDITQTNDYEGIDSIQYKNVPNIFIIITLIGA